MAHQAHDTVADGYLNIIDNAVMLRVVSGAGAPVDRAAAVTATLASVVVDGTDFTDADGDVSGRKVTVAAQTGVSITASGTATHICLDDGTTLLYTNTCTSQALTSGGTVNVPAYDIEVRDPS